MQSEQTSGSSAEVSSGRPLVAIRTSKQVSRASVAKALGLPLARVEYYEDHAPLTTLEYLVNLKRSLGLSWSAVGAILEQSVFDSRAQATPLRGRGRPRKGSELKQKKETIQTETSVAVPKRPRGRPRKESVSVDSSSSPPLLR